MKRQDGLQKHHRSTSVSSSNSFVSPRREKRKDHGEGDWAQLDWRGAARRDQEDSPEDDDLETEVINALRK